MKLTEKRALEICRDLWAWLEENPKGKKYDWPGWRENGGTIPEMVFNCPCCEYAARERGVYPECKQCPLSHFWIENAHGDPSGNAPCERNGSPYLSWRFAISPVGKAEAAHAIHQAAVDALDKLKGAKK